MVKATHTTVAWTTVLRVIFHIGLTYLTVELETLGIEGISILFGLFLYSDWRIRWVVFSGFIGIHDHKEEDYTIQNAQYTANGRWVSECDHSDEVKGIGIQSNNEVWYDLEGM